MYLGIDLGTSNSAVVGYDGERLTVFKTAEGADVLPSGLFINAQGRRFVGRRAYEQAAISPENVALAFKRMMGTSTPVRFAAAALTLSAEDASADVLRTLMSQAALESGSPAVTGTVITMPAAFNQMQTEATLRAAEMADIRPVALLHEPIAAAMASMATAKARSGQFLVYDLGGGTFDAALVKSSNGVVDVIAHEGINMLGGRDHDEALLRSVVMPWLQDNFDLPDDYALRPEIQTLLRRVRLRLEQAKIELTTRDQTQLFVSEDELRVRDRSGADVYLDVEISRGDLERLIEPEIERSIALCAKMIADQGYRHDDLDRVVLIGGPSKMPIVRSRVPEMLGIAVDLSTDPMTAVACGAAIYAESRDWGTTRSTRKPTRATEMAATGVRFDFAARTAEDNTRLRITGCTDHRVRIDADDGWTSGEIVVSTEHKLALPLSRQGANDFKVHLSREGSTAEIVSLTIVRTAASSAGMPLTHTLAVAVEEDDRGRRKDRPHAIAKKGETLPLSGTEHFVAARTLVGGSDERIDIGFFQTSDDINDLSLARSVGAFELKADVHLDAGQVLRAGSRIDVHWQIDENGIVLANISLPDLGMSFDSPRFYSSAAGHKNFLDEEGAQYVATLSEDADSSLSAAQEALSHTARVELAALRQRLVRQLERVAQSAEPEVRRQAAEEIMAVREDLYRLTHEDGNRAAVLNRDVATVEELFENHLRTRIAPSEAARFDQLSRTARAALDANAIKEAEHALDQMRSVMVVALLEIPQFLIEQFENLAQERIFASDKSVHDRLVQVGQRCIQTQDWSGLRQVNFGLNDNRVALAPMGRSKDILSGLMRAAS